MVKCEANTMKTTLYERHKELGAQFVEFGAWEMPLQYRGLREEHEAVRARVGLFDVSHMGRIVVEGPDAEAFMDYIAANRIVGKSDYSATYSVLCSRAGTCIDDTIIYKIDRYHFFMIANAANRHKDLMHLHHVAKDFTVTIVPCFEEEGILAIQGPLAHLIIAAIFPESRRLTKPMHFIETSFHGRKVYLSTTGYTGAGGYEVYAPDELLEELWELILRRGAPHGIAPVGLGARNTLRLEMGYALYGHEIDDTIAPTESVAAWSVKLNKPDFLGKSALLTLEGSPTKRSSHGLRLLAPGVVRDHYALFKEGQAIGRVTSGGYSPTLNQSIALVLTHASLEIGERIEVQIRQHMSLAEVVVIPFITHSNY